MSLKSKFIIWGATVYILIALAMFSMYHYNKWLFIVSEVFVLLSIILFSGIYKKFVKPVEILKHGAKLLKDKDFNTTLSAVNQPEIDELISVYNNMARALREERIKQREQDHLLSLLIKASPMGIIIYDFDDKITNINPATEKILGISFNEVENKKIDEIQCEFSEEISKLEINKTVTLKTSGINRHRAMMAHFLDRGFTRKFIMIEELSKELVKAERQAYGKVIRMMAHEVNNSVGAVNSIMESMLDFTSTFDGELKNDYHTGLNVAIERNRNMSCFMRNFADVVKLPSPKKQEIELNSFLKGIQDLMSPFCEKQKVKILFESNIKEANILADKGQMEQCLVNIIKNAVEAIEEEGKITIKIIDNPFSVSIFDTGKGITEENSKHIFSPFFSTKPKGQGIGLTLVRDILFNHGFEFSLKTLKKELTEFKIVFGNNT